MIRRILAAVLVVLGLVAVGLAVASATVWRPSDTVTASMPAQPTAPVVIVEPGVLAMVADTVTLTASAAAEDDPVVLAFAPTGDVMAWVGPAAHVAVTGMSSWTDLRVEEVEGEESVPNPAGADLWTSELTDTGELVVELSPDPGDVAMIAATDGTRAAPSITLTWTVPVTNPYLVPLVAAGVALLVLGLAVLAYDILVRREVRARENAREARRTADATATSQLSLDSIAAEAAEPVETVEAAATAGPATLTRRQRRELERRRRQEDPRLAADGPVARSGGMAGAGIVPAVLDPERHRALRYVDVPEEAPEPAQEPVPAPSAERDAGPARGSAIVPGVADPEHHRQEPSEPERTSWRSLWGFGEEEQR
ncbi:MAG: hypothetical protein ACQERF_03470 [Actinomycetota bacterium]